MLIVIATSEVFIGLKSGEPYAFSFSAATASKEVNSEGDDIQF